MTINRVAIEFFGRPPARLMLLWDRAARKIGFQAMEDDELRAFRVSYPGRGLVGQISAVGFLKHIEYGMGAKQFQPTFDAATGTLEVTLPE